MGHSINTFTSLDFSQQEERSRSNCKKARSENISGLFI